MIKEIAPQVAQILKDYNPTHPHITTTALQEYWLTFEPDKSLLLVKAEQRAQYKAVGIPVPVLKAIGKALSIPAHKDVDDFLPLAQMLWDEYGREGRVIASLVFGALELSAPERIVPIIKDNCRTCISWEDADRLAMDALEPIVRKQPEIWLDEMVTWLSDENKWNRRAAITIIGRLPMKAPTYADKCITLCEELLPDNELDVKRAVSFALRICAKVAPDQVIAFLQQHVPPDDPAATWVLCDVIKSLGKKQLPQFTALFPLYKEWLAQPNLVSKDRRSIESAIKLLH